MEIIAVVEDHFIAKVSRDELARVFNKYHYDMPKLNPGDSVDLADGYNFRNEIVSVCKTMLDADKSFKKSHKTFLAFASMIVEQAGEDKKDL